MIRPPAASPLVLVVSLALAACNGSGGGAPGGSGGSGASSAGSGAAGPGVGGAGNGSASSATTSTGVTSGSVGAGGSTAFVCDPPAAPGSIYEHSAESYDIDQIDPVSMCKYRGQVALVVNTAAKCGYTPQYAPLEALEAKYKADGLHVLGFLSNDFAQAGTEDDIEKCTMQYGVTFEQFALVHVKIGADQHPLFKWLTTRPGLEGDVSWNFNKWLVGRDGTLVARWSQGTEPDAPAVVAAIEAELAK